MSEQDTLDPYASASNMYSITSENYDADGYLQIAIKVDKYDCVVRNPDAVTRDEVLATCARTAQEIRTNKTPKPI